MRTGALEGVLADAIAKASERPGRRRPSRSDAQRRPRRDRPARAHRRRRRTRGRGARRRTPCAPDARRDRRRPRGRDRPSPARPRSSTSSTAPASRCTATATTCASSPATSPTITHRRSRGRRGRADLPRARRHPRRRDPLARRGRRPAPVPGHDVAVRRRGAARAPCCIRGSSTCCTSTARTCSTSRSATRLPILERVVGASHPRRGHRRPGVAERVSRDALAAGHEGVVVKAIDSLYAAGRRG